MEAKHLRIKQAPPTRRSLYCVIVAAIFIVFNLAICLQISRSRSVLLLGTLSALALLFIYVVFYLMRERRGIAAHALFLVLLIFLGLLCMAVFLPMTAPDEPYHYFESYFYSNLLLFVPSEPGGIMMRGSDISPFRIYSTQLSGQYFSDLINEWAFFAEDAELKNFAGFPGQGFDIGANPPQTKILSALGITLGRLLGLGAIPVFYLGRVFNFAGFVVLVYLAVRFAPVGKRIFMIVACLPMSLHIATSYSYDATIIGLAFLLIALCLRAIFAEEKLSAGLKVSIGVVVFLLAPCKVVYSVLAFLVLLIPKSKFETRRACTLYKIGVIAIAAFAIVILRLPALVSMSQIPSADAQPSIRGEDTGVFYSVGDILGNPLAFVSLLIRTIHVSGGFYIGSMIGSSLGWLQITGPWYVILAFLLLLLLAMPKSVMSDLQIKGTQKTVFACIFVIGAFLVCLSMYLAWTFNTESVIQGVQGRYFIPLLPLLLLVFRSDVLVATKDYSWTLLYAAGLLNVAYVTWLYATILAL